MALSIVTNLLREPVALPPPFNGVLNPSASAVVQGDPESVIALLGGQKSRGIFGVNPAPGGAAASTIGPVPDTTLGAFTVNVDTSKGVDPAAGVTLRQQADVPATPFKTLNAVIAALPEYVRHPVTLAFADGVYQLDTILPFGDFARLRFGLPNDYNFNWTGDISPGGQVIFKSLNGSQRVSGTPLMTAAVNADPTIFQASVDPGFTADQYRRYYLRIASGTGAGQVKAIRTHSTVNFTVAGRFSPAPDGTSKVEVIQASASLNVNKALQDLMGGAHPYDTNHPTMTFNDIDITTALTGATFFATNWAVLFSSARLLGVGIAAIECSLAITRVIIDALNKSGTPISLAGGFVRNFGADDSTIIGGDNRASKIGINISGDTSGPFRSLVVLFQMAIDDIAIGIQVRGVGGHFQWTGQRLTGRNITTAGVKLVRSGNVIVSSTDIVATGALGSDAPTQFIIDGVNKSAADLAGATNNYILGAVGSVLQYTAAGP